MAKFPFVSRILRILGGRRAHDPTLPPHLSRILRMLAETEPVELSCDEVFRLLDEFVELQAAGHDPAEYFPLVNKHLKVCGDCREEYEALLSMIGAGSQLAVPAS